MPFLAEPNFNAIQNQVLFASDRLNTLLSKKYYDTYGFYQAMFMPYAWMPLTKDMTYRIHSLETSAFIWQPHNSCNWNPVGAMETGNVDITPARAKINAEQCYDTLFDSAFASFLEWGRGDSVEMDANGEDYVNKMIESILAAATYGARLSNVVGQLYSPGSVTFDADVSVNVREAFNATIGTVKGWIELAKDRAASGVDHLNISGLIPGGDIDATGKKYTGNVITLYDNILDAAKGDLVAAVNEGGSAGFNDSLYPILFVSPSIFNAFVDYWRTQATTAAQNVLRVTREPVDYNTANGTRKINVMKIDETIIVPINELNYLDKHITGATHCAYLTLSGNINLGGSFGSIPQLGNEVGLAIQRANNLDEIGKYKMLAHALHANAFADTNFIAGGQTFAEPS